MKKYAIIVAGGQGSRMNTNIPKQFIVLGGKPILMHTIERFHLADTHIEIVLVLPEKEVPQWNELCAKYSFHIPHQIALGGETRFLSVRNGLAKVALDSIVAVHDAVRPFVSKMLILRCYAEAQSKGSAVPYIPVVESMRKMTEAGNKKVMRSDYVIVQTPQCFSAFELKKVYAKKGAGYRTTDDASVYETAGKKIHLIEGERENIKITFPLDLIIAEAILRKFPVNG